MKMYKVEWGEDCKCVHANDAAEAWAKFCEAHPIAIRHPRLYEQIVTEVTPHEASVLASSGDESSENESPVEGESANEAKDEISRMRSKEKLQDIADNDPRPTVRASATKRLEEIG
jgi:hypothetical protein